MLELKAADVVCSNGHVIFTFHGIDGFDPRPLMNCNVFIDGRLERITGVETFAIHDATGHPFGLRVHRPAGLGAHDLGPPADYVPRST